MPSDVGSKIPGYMDEYWDVVIVDGEPVRLLGTDEEQLREMIRLVNDRPQHVSEIVRRAKEEDPDGGVTLWLNPQTLDTLTKLPENLL